MSLSTPTTDLTNPQDDLKAETNFRALTDLGILKRILILKDQTIDIGSITAGLAVQTDVTVNGAEVGDPAFASAPSNLPDHVAVFAFVHSANTVRLRVANHSNSTVDPPSGDYTIVVFDTT